MKTTNISVKDKTGAVSVNQKDSSKNLLRVETDDWIVEIREDNVTISYFIDCHFVDNITLTKEEFATGFIDKILELKENL